jgi:two-component system, NarL family, sensor histidine kinase UhpB
MADVSPSSDRPKGAGNSPMWWSEVSRGDLFAMPVLYRVLIANCVVLVTGALLGTAIVTEASPPNRPSIFVVFIIVGILLSTVVNFVLLKIALDPLTQLRDTMRRVEAGDMTLRASISGYDPDADELAATFNHMLSRLEESSRSRATQVLRAQEEERRRLARELHDETSQSLTSLLVSLATVEKAVPDPEAHARVAQAREVAHDTLRAIRTLSLSLRPSALDDLGLVAALRGYVKNYQQQYTISVTLHVHGFRERFATETETAIYRIVQEALTNVAKHAHATQVTIDLAEEQGLAHLRVQDNGEGFSPQAVPAPSAAGGGLGLIGMRERAMLLDGKLEMQSQPGNGTMVIATIPLKPESI